MDKLMTGCNRSLMLCIRLPQHVQHFIGEIIAVDSKTTPSVAMNGNQVQKFQKIFVSYHAINGYFTFRALISALGPGLESVLYTANHRIPSSERSV